MTPYYADDRVTLYHGDCREVTEWLAADVLVTDPPYGIAWESGGLHSDQRVRTAAVQSIRGDEDTTIRDDVLRMWGATRPAVMFGSWRRPRPAGVTQRLIWHKQGRKPGVAAAAFYPTDEEVYLIGSGWTGPPASTVITTTEPRELQPARIGHPTPKPIRLMEHLVTKCPDGVIADPFAGSGSTLVAARNLGRQAIGVEIEERYCEIAARRLAQDVLPLEAGS